MQGFEARLSTLVLRDSSVGLNIELPNTVPVATIADADAVVVGGVGHWVRSTVQTIHALGIRRPVLVVPADNTVPSVTITGADIVMGAGASESERAACVRSLHWLARLRGHIVGKAPIGALGNRVMDRARQSLFLDGIEYVFGRTAFGLLAYLVERAGQWVTSEDLVRYGLGTHHSTGSSVVRFHIHSIRNRLGEKKTYILSDTRYRRGYMFSLDSPQVPFPVPRAPSQSL